MKGILQIKNLFFILIIAVLVNYLFTTLFAFSIPSFEGGSITGIFTETLQTNFYYGYLILGSQVFFFFAVNRVCVLLEKDPERDPNETIMKAKKFSAAGFIFGMLMIITFFLFVEVRIDIIINDYIYNARAATDNYQALFDLPRDDANALLITHLIYAAVWVIILGIFFIVGTLFTNFYVGRLISYYANQKKNEQGNHKWRIIEVFGMIWSVQFLISFFIPWEIGLILHGVLSVLFILVIFSLSKEENISQIRFKSLFKLKIEENQLKSKNSKHFERIVQISMFFSLILFITLWYGATFYYSYNKEWYDWGFYISVGLLILIFPLFSLIYSKTLVGQWILKKSFLIISLIGMLYFSLAIFAYSDILTNLVYGIFFTEKLNYTVLSPGFVYKPGQVIILFLLFFTCMISLIGLKHGLLPIHKSDRRKLRQYLNIKTLSRPSKLFLIIFCVSVGFSFISYEGLGAYVRLENDPEFVPRISFWEWARWDDHDNATLDKLSEYNINLYGGWGIGEEYKSDMERYYDRNISIRATSHNYQWIDWIIDQRENEGWDKCPIDGFIEDIEAGGSLFDFNLTKSEQKRAHYEELIDYAHRHNFTQSFTAMHTTINDQRDGDLDVSIFNQIHSFPPLNWDLWNWMIYRTEAATHYEEESPYFTYLWVKEMKESVNLIYGDKYNDRLSVSVGVTAKDRNLYAAEDGFDQLLWDLRICNALRIPEIIIFVMNPLDGDNFLGMFGLEGIDRIVEGMNNWTTLDLPYSRCATFLGNIKYIDNPMGSVFGNYWLDLFLDNGLIFFAITWIVLQLTVYIIYIKKILSKKEPSREDV